jgi:hypothetical protein
VICAPPGSNKLQAKFCSPANGATVPSIFTVTGAGNSPAGLLRFELWVDGAKKLETRNDQLSSSQTLASGTHTLTLVAVDLFGAYSKSTETVTSNSPTCYPSTPGATICYPAPNSTVTSPVQLSAGVTAQSGYITALRVYVDNNALLTVYNGQRTNTFAINQPVFDPLRPAQLSRGGV